VSKRENLRVGMVCYPTPGGSGVVATELGKSLAARGHEVHFICNGHPARLTEFTDRVYLHKVETGDYPVFQQYTPYALSLAVKIREVSEQYDLDLVHAHYAIPHATSAYLARQMLDPVRRLRTMTTLHGTDITLVGMMPSFYEITRFSILASDAVTTVSQFLQRETVEQFRVDRPIDVIYNFVDGDEFRPAAAAGIRERLGPRGERLLFHVSNFRKVKNLPAVVDVFAGVRGDMPCRLVLIGDGPEREPTERRVAELGIAADVVFLGDQEHIAGVLPAADVFLLPSEHESFGLAALEAMACAVPVVGSRIGGLPEVIADGETGFVCDPHDVSCMRAIVLGLLRDEDRRRAVGAAARKRALERFSRDDIVNRYEDAYHRLVGEGGRG
jgi:N-acetyl-alpha-D-glucosaminyl L-malate synthase BshA